MMDRVNRTISIMDTNTHDLQRVSYSSSGTSDDLIYLDDELFAEPVSTQECEAEFALLKDRERQRPRTSAGGC